MILLTKTPLWILGLLAGLLTLLSMSGPLLVRRRISLERLSTNNEVAGFKFATIGVIYAVLLGFAVITVLAKAAPRSLGLSPVSTKHCCMMSLKMPGGPR